METRQDHQHKNDGHVRSVERVKNLYMGQFNLFHQTLILRCHAYSEAQAKTLFVKRLAKQHGISERIVWGQFDGTKSNYAIQKEIEYQ